MVLMLGLVLLVYLPPAADGYDCIERCSPRNYGTPLVAPSMEDDHCLIRLPDNPVREGNRTYPCQLAIKPNCTGYCHIHLTFSKLTLKTCDRNITDDDPHCSDLHSCEYVILREQGVDENGEEVSLVTRFHGNLTRGSYESKSDSVMIQFCYRSETFSGRNIQILYRAIDPLAPIPVNRGPASVYVLGCVVVLLIAGIVMIRWSPWLKPCLDPPPQKPDDQIDF